MKTSNPCLKGLTVSALALICAVAAQSLAFTRSYNPPAVARAAVALAQYDDPYAEFRNARYSNAGLLNERDEIKIGAQLHREVTKKYPLTDVGLDRVDQRVFASGRSCLHHYRHAEAGQRQ
jgi:hypothetical protein